MTNEKTPTAVVTGNCPACKAAWTLSVPRAGFLTWKAGTLIQDALPGLPPANRELLISGTCGQCFSALFDLGPEPTADDE